MIFTDESNSTYTIHIYNETDFNHELNYNSKKPYIKKITWDI